VTPLGLSSGQVRGGHTPLNPTDEEQILERITSQDWSGLALKPTVDMGRGVMATRFFRSGLLEPSQAIWHNPPYQLVLDSVPAPVP
jgi:hypothetical protein